MRGQYLINKIKGTIYKKIYGTNRYLAWKGIKMGVGNHIYSDISTTESYLIELGNNITISKDVLFVTHDNSICKVSPQYTDVFGKVIIGDDCFIGARSIIMPGVTLASNTIVAAGSVVVKSVSEPGCIIGGNPAKVIGNTEEYKNRIEPYGINLDMVPQKDKKKVISGCKHIIK